MPIRYSGAMPRSLAKETFLTKNHPSFRVEICSFYLFEGMGVFSLFAKGLADIRLGGVVVALAVELAATGQLKPALKMLGYGLVEQSALGVAWVVEFGPAVGGRWSGVHRAMPWWA